MASARSRASLVSRPFSTRAGPRTAKSRSKARSRAPRSWWAGRRDPSPGRTGRPAARSMALRNSWGPSSSRAFSMAPARRSWTLRRRSVAPVFPKRFRRQSPMRSRMFRTSLRVRFQSWWSQRPTRRQKPVRAGGESVASTARRLSGPEGPATAAGGRRTVQVKIMQVQRATRGMRFVIERTRFRFGSDGSVADEGNSRGERSFT